MPHNFQHEVLACYEENGGEARIVRRDVRDEEKNGHPDRLIVVERRIQFPDGEQWREVRQLGASIPEDEISGDTRRPKRLPGRGPPEDM